ncbi:hypothetical protein G6F42_008055 [Rhizopus arrhizus]|nr:hypothetical protein G6F42_008055 [Rhizopus arrhizus]
MSTTSESSQGQFSFYHFDQASDFGIETENGERIKKKKRPGRKPNPPSAEKRRAQNRAAQKAYRQRHREKRENVEKTLEDYKKENEALKRKCAQTEFEANYLRAIVLQLTLTSLVQQGSVAHAWVSEDSELDMPSLLKMMLDRNKHIARLSKAFRALFQADSVLSCGKKFSKNMNSVAISRKQDILSEAIPSDNLENIPSGDSENISLDGSEGGATPHHDHSLILHKKPLKSVLTQPPSLQTADDFIHMSPLQALHISRIQLKFTSIMGPDMIASLKPTVLQRIIPHDIRIDYIPVSSIRDRMILFQDYYDADDCFQYLAQTVLFTGGDVRNIKNWTLHPDYSSKFWFISHLFIDQVEINQIDKHIEALLVQTSDAGE